MRAGEADAGIREPRRLGAVTEGYGKTDGKHGVNSAEEYKSVQDDGRTGRAAGGVKGRVTIRAVPYEAIVVIRGKGRDCGDEEGISPGGRGVAAGKKCVAQEAERAQSRAGA